MPASLRDEVRQSAAAFKTSGSEVFPFATQVRGVTGSVFSSSFGFGFLFGAALTCAGGFWFVGRLG